MRALGLRALKPLVADHFVGEELILKAGGYKKAAATVANSLPSSKKTQSGDLGELLATEYVNSETAFVVPINKLRWKSDRQMAMHGNDVIGVDQSVKPIRVLKGECKSRRKFGCASNSWVEVAPVLFWADNLNVFNHSDWRRCGSIPAGPGVASEGPVPPIGESRRFSPRHHFRELPQVRQEQLCMCS